MGGVRQLLGPAVDAGLDADGQAIAGRCTSRRCRTAERVDLLDDLERVTRPAHDVEHWAKDFLLQVADVGHLIGLRCNQIWYVLYSCLPLICLG